MSGLARYLSQGIEVWITEPPVSARYRPKSGAKHALVPPLRQAIYSRLAGYEDVNDAKRLSVDPAMRHLVGTRVAMVDNHAVSTSEELFPLSW